MSDYPASVTYPALVAMLDHAGFRPRPVRSLPGFAAWGAPDLHTAWCPACGTDGALVVEPWASTDPHAVLWCTNEGRCPSHAGAHTEAAVHSALCPHIEPITKKGPTR
jgi:hypothetical protein